jgi:hypothetical protein
MMGILFFLNLPTLETLLHCEIAAYDTLIASQRKIKAQKKLKLFCLERRGKASK